jgi:hypothetical protein
MPVSSLPPSRPPTGPFRRPALVPPNIGNALLLSSVARDEADANLDGYLPQAESRRIEGAGKEVRGTAWRNTGHRSKPIGNRSCCSVAPPGSSLYLDFTFLFSPKVLPRSSFRCSSRRSSRCSSSWLVLTLSWLWGCGGSFDFKSDYKRRLRRRPDFLTASALA